MNLTTYRLTDAFTPSPLLFRVPSLDALRSRLLGRDVLTAYGLTPWNVDVLIEQLGTYGEGNMRGWTLEAVRE